MTNPVDWTTFQASQLRRKQLAHQAANAMQQGNPALAATCLNSWSFAPQRDWMDAVLHQLQARPPSPCNAGRAAISAPTEIPLPTTKPHPPWRYREHLSDHPPPTDIDPLTWGLTRLSTIGEELTPRYRAPWTHEPSPPHTNDSATLQAWIACISGGMYTARDRWEALFLPTSRRVFSSILRARRVPAPRHPVILADHNEAFFYRLMGIDGGTPGWIEIATRVLETSGAPLHNLAALLQIPDWDRAPAGAPPAAATAPRPSNPPSPTWATP